MAIPIVLTYDLTPTPRRPGIADVGGAAFIDDQTDPPDPGTMPSAAMENQNEFLIVAAHRVIPVLVFSLRFSAGAPILDSFQCLPTTPITGTFTITDMGTGDTKVEWPANTFPTAVNKPDGGITGTTVGMIAVEAITNGVRVRTFNSAAAATDLPCTVRAY